MAGHIVQSIKNNKNDVDLFLNDKNVGVAIFQVVILHDLSFSKITNFNLLEKHSKDGYRGVKKV